MPGATFAGDGPADGQRPRVQSVESETIHFPNPAFLVQRVNDSERSERMDARWDPGSGMNRH
ncbi:hypothetical protein, partial [Pseudoalteromonas luteoviolacea]|uniref:hypothetical protein n=1 Tax=Pseudoalteromonas luteoviolacea TaxID=43657 RepID=UPI000B1218B5